MTHKPLELTVYLPDGSGDYEHPVDGLWVAKAYIDYHMEAKRLTDTELAAEYWCEEKSLGDVRDWIKTQPGYQLLELVLLERVLTFHRFATLPHYDEAPDA